MQLIKIRITEKKLKKYFGYAYPDLFKVELSKNLKDKTYLGTLIHEILHVLYPDQSETSITQFAATLTHYIWKKGYRSGRKASKKKS